MISMTFSAELRQRLITLEDAKNSKTPVYARSPACIFVDGKQVDLYFKVDNTGAKLPSFVEDELRRGGVLKF